MANNRIHQIQHKFSPFWGSLKDGAQWVAELRTKRIDILAALISILGTGFLVPFLISVDANDRENRERCFTAILELRDSINTLDGGFFRQPNVLLGRVSDLRGTALALENSEFACRGTELYQDGEQKLLKFQSESEHLLAKIQEGAFEDYEDFHSTNFSAEVSGWSQQAMRRLTNDNTTGIFSWLPW